jgi:hypothetical protein
MSVMILYAGNSIVRSKVLKMVVHKALLVGSIPVSSFVLPVDSERVRFRPHKRTHPEPLNIPVEQFLAMLRFEGRSKLAELPDDLMKGRSG